MTYWILFVFFLVGMTNWLLMMSLFLKINPSLNCWVWFLSFIKCAMGASPTVSSQKKKPGCNWAVKTKKHTYPLSILCCLLLSFYFFFRERLSPSFIKKATSLRTRSQSKNKTAGHRLGATAHTGPTCLHLTLQHQHTQKQQATIQHSSTSTQQKATPEHPAPASYDFCLHQHTFAEPRAPERSAWELALFVVHEGEPSTQ